MLVGLLRSMRFQHWAKNAFVLAPLVFSRRLLEPEALAASLAAFLAFCLASSAVYLFNDVLDRDQDRLHPVKKNRPIATGEVPPGAALGTAAVLVALALAGAGWFSREVLLLTGIYLVVNLLYTISLKNVVILDVMLIALGFVLRVMAGGAAIRVEVSAWLLLCTTFLALFLAFSKRRHELLIVPDDPAAQRSVLSHYSPAFLDQMINVVTASSVVSYAVYAISPETVEKFHTQHLIYTMPMVLFGIFRYLYLIYQESTVRNPTEAILRDPPFLLNIVLWGMAVVWIVYRG